MSKKKKDLMNDPNYVNFEWGKVDLATKVNDLLDYSLKENINIQEFAKKFKKEYAPYINIWGKTKPTKFELKFNYLETYKYRGFKIKVFDDDSGQQYYFYFNNKCIGCGAYNFDYKGCIENEVDHYLDDIFDFYDLDKKYAGAYLKYNNHEHTEILFTYRLDMIKVIFYPKEDGTFNIEEIKQHCVDKLEDLFASEEFHEKEKSRKQSNNIYFKEVMDKLRNKENE